MKQLTTTKAMYRDIAISVSSDRIGVTTMFCCATKFRGPSSEEKWFETQGQAIANERNEIDGKLGIPPWKQDNPEGSDPVNARKGRRGGRK